MRRTILTALFAAAVMAAAAPAAQAATSLSISPNLLPDSVVAGSRANAGTLTISNVSTGAQATGTVEIDTIDLGLACKAFSNPCGSPDPGVIVMRAGNTPTGRAGTACAGLTFGKGPTDAATGLLRLNPSADLSLTQPGSGATATCTIDFAFDVRKMPTADPDVSPGIQTVQNPRVFATHTGSAQSGFGVDNMTTTVEKATPVITPILQPTRHQKKPLRFFVGISGLAGPNQGTLTFTPFGPNGCTNPAGSLLGASQSIGSNGTYESLPFAAPKRGWAPGFYGAAINYSGDVNNNPVQLPCGQPMHVVSAAKCKKKENKGKVRAAGAAKKKGKKCKKKKGKKKLSRSARAS
jgi:hypothetical protein